MSNDISSNQIECTRCGAIVFYELTRCPECGLNFFPTSENDPDGINTTEAETSFGFAGIYPVAVIAGLMTFALIAFLVHFVAGSLARGELGTGIQILLAVIDFSAALGAGYLVGYLAEDNQISHGIVVGFASIGIRILFDAFWRDLTSEGLLTPWVLLSWILILLGAGSGAWFMRNRSLRVDHILFPEADSLYLNLMSKVNYDQELVERLIEYERQRSPDANRTVWLKRAIERWERDNRI